MRLFIKSENEDGEIEFYRTDNGELMVSILNGHGSTYYILNNNEVDSLISYINITDERLD